MNTIFKMLKQISMLPLYQTKLVHWALQMNDNDTNTQRKADMVEDIKDKQISSLLELKQNQITDN